MCMDVRPHQAEALIHQGESNLIRCQKTQREETHSFGVVVLNCSVSYTMTQTRRVQHWLLCAEESLLLHYFMKNKCVLSRPRKAGSPGVILGKAVIGGFLLICGEELFGPD